MIVVLHVVVVVAMVVGAWAGVFELRGLLVCFGRFGRRASPHKAEGLVARAVPRWSWESLSATLASRRRRRQSHRSLPPPWG